MLLIRLSEELLILRRSLSKEIFIPDRPKVTHRRLPGEKVYTKKNTTGTGDNLMEKGLPEEVKLYLEDFQGKQRRRKMGKSRFYRCTRWRLVL